MNALLRPCGGLALSLALLTAAPAHALELEVKEPPPTVYGSNTAFEAVVRDVAGTAEIRWTFGDGSGTEFSTSGANAQHTYEALGHYSVIVVARDDAGFTSHTFMHTVHTRPTPEPPRSSSSVVFDPERALVITANTDNDTITLVDAEDLAKVAEIPVFVEPAALALAPDGNLWVVCRDDYAIAIVDLDAGRIVDALRLPYASQPVGIVFSPDGDAYVTLMAVGDVVRIDGSTHEIVDQTHVVPFAHGIALAADGESLWVTRFLSQGERGEVYRLDASSLDILSRYDLAEDTTTEDSDVQGRGLPNYLFSIAITPDGTQAWVPGKKDNMARGLQRDGLELTQDNTVRPLVSILDLTEHQELYERRIDLDDRNLPRHVTFSPLGDYAFVSVYGSNLVEVRDVFDGSFVSGMRGSRGPAASTLTPAERLFVLGDLGRTLSVYDVGDLIAGRDRETRLLAEIPLVAAEKLSPEVLRGKQLFANADDVRMAREGYVSCATCHFDGFEDGLVWDFTDRGEGLRNTTSLLGRRGTGHGPVHWSANFDEIQDFENPIRAHQGGLGFLTQEEFETGTRSDPLGDAKAGVNADLDDLAAYVTSLDRIPRSPFRNPDGTLTERGIAGRALFLELGCDSCHAGDDFTDSAEGKVHDVGTLTALSGNRLGGELLGIDTPTLLGIWQTAPYLHDGSAPTLRDVLTTRNPEGKHGDVSDLSEQQLEDLVAYLQQVDQGLPPRPLDYSMGGAGGSDADVGDPAPSEAGAGCGCELARTSASPGLRLSGLLWTSLAVLPLVRRRGSRRSAESLSRSR